MQASTEELEILIEIQGIDRELLQAKKERASLPQRIQVAKIRKKREEIIPKVQQVDDLKKSTQKKMTVIEDEDHSLAQKQERAEEIIKAAGSDFRKAESHSKDMAGIAKRRDTLAQSFSKLSEEMDKISSVHSQLEQALAALDDEERSLCAAYQAKDTELVEKSHELMKRRDELVNKVSRELIELYSKTAKKAGGIALGELEEGGICSACRVTISGGRLIDLMSQQPLGICPSCSRLLVIYESTSA